MYILLSILSIVTLLTGIAGAINPDWTKDKKTGKPLFSSRRKSLVTGVFTSFMLFIFSLGFYESKPLTEAEKVVNEIPAAQKEKVVKGIATKIINEVYDKFLPLMLSHSASMIAPNANLEKRTKVCSSFNDDRKHYMEVRKRGEWIISGLGDKSKQQYSELMEHLYDNGCTKGLTDVNMRIESLCFTMKRMADQKDIAKRTQDALSLIERDALKYSTDVLEKKAACLIEIEKHQL